MYYLFEIELLSIINSNYWLNYIISYVMIKKEIERVNNEMWLYKWNKFSY